MLLGIIVTLITWSLFLGTYTTNPFGSSIVMSDSDFFIAGAFSLGITIIYLLPSWIGILRKKGNKTAITVLNLFLGWTFFGWVIALVWALTKDKQR